MYGYRYLLGSNLLTEPFPTSFGYSFAHCVPFEDKVCWSQYQLVQPLFCSIYDLKSSVKVWHCCNLAHYNPSIFSRTIRILQGEKSFVHFKNDFVSEKHCYYYNLLNSSFTSFLFLLYAVAVCCNIEHNSFMDPIFLRFRCNPRYYKSFMALG